MDSGTIVAGRFRIEGPPAVGGMGEVHLATDLSTDRRVALKLLRWRSASLDARFAREATLLAELSHPGIVGYVAHGMAADGNAYLAMEWIDGELLSHRLRRGALSVTDTLALGSAVAEALAVAHGRRIVHRDLKPGNLLCEAGEPCRAKILDFGLARNDAASLLGVTRTGELAGTPGYMAPEQARGLHDVDARADVYSLGCVLYECLSGRPAFTGEHVFAVLAKILVEEVPRVGEVAPGVPAALDELVMRTLAKDPRDRPVDAAELLAELQRVIDSAGAAPRGEAAVQALGRSEQRVLCVILAAGEPPPDNPDEAPTVSERAQQATTASLTSTVKAHGGVLDRVAGGHVVITFQGAGTATDLAARAGRCALTVAGLLPETQVAIATGRGVSRERVLVGAVIDAAASLIARAFGEPAGASPGSEAGAIGARLAAWRPVRIDEVTAGLLDSRFELGTGDSGSLLLGYTESREAERTLLGQATPFVGRDRELTNLLAIVEECCAEPLAQCVLVTGAAGAGKSRLRTELVRRMADSDDVRVWTGRGDPMSAGAPLALLAQMIRREAGIRYGEEARPARRKLRARVGRHVAAEQVERLSEFLGEMCGIPFDDERRPELRAARRDASVMGDQMRRAWEELIAAECAAAPLLIVLEDLHWGDLPTVRFIDATLRTLARQPLLVLALARPEVHELFPDLWSSRGVQIVTLRPLTERAARRLVEQTLGDGTADSAVRRIVEQAAGNPFYLEELIRAAAVGQDQPGTVLAMLGARLEALPGERRRLLRAASILGEAFWPAALGALVDRDAAWIASALEALVEQEWLVRRSESVRADHTEYAFRHALVREAAYAMLTDEDRVLGHRLAAAWLERAGDADAITVGEHFERGGEPGRAVRWYARAARQAMDGTDLAAAVERARRGLACAAASGADPDAHREELGVLRAAIAEASRWGGNNVEAEREGLAALAVLPEGGEAWYTTLVQVIVAAARVDHLDRVIAIAEQLRDAAVDPARAAPWVRAAEQAAMRLIFAGDRLDLVDALRALIEARVALGVGDDPSLPARAALVNAYHADYRGDLVAAERHHAEAFALFERLGYQRIACALRHDLGLMALAFGDWALGEETLRAALADAERLGMGGQASTARQNLGYVLAHLGHLAEAEDLARRSIAEFAAIGDRRMEAGSRQYLAIIRLLAGDVAGAEASIREALAVENRASPSRAMSLAVLAECRLRQGDAGEALTAAGDGLHIVDALGGSIAEGEARIRLVWAQALRASGEPEAAVAAIQAAVARIEARARLIDDPARRARFVEAIPEHATTLRLADEWVAAASEEPAGDMTEPG